jgi:hypothetical protein
LLTKQNRLPELTGLYLLQQLLPGLGLRLALRLRWRGQAPETE